METACLKIKFTPLLQETHKNNSKCCLEIVPEVSCIQNLEKLTWKQESNFIEYTIPMTYKIILRKRQVNIKDTSDEIVKTYHSCVDLLLSSSQSNNDLISSDVSRIISDTFILSRTPLGVPLKENTVTTSDNDSEINENGITTVDTTLKVLDSTAKEIEKEVINDDITKLDPERFNVDDVAKISCDKLTNTESILPIFTDSLRFGRSPNYTSSPESERKLSVSPICSINTQDTTNSLPKSITSKAINCKIYDSQRELVPLRYISTLSDQSHENALSKIISPGNGSSELNSIKSIHFTPSDRSPPEIRVAQYVHYIEKELLPLNVILDELINKCSMLGVHQIRSKITKPPINYLPLYKSVCMYNNCIKSETCEKSISNRAVYSIVFDG